MAAPTAQEATAQHPQSQATITQLALPSAQQEEQEGLAMPMVAEGGVGDGDGYSEL